MPNREAIVDAVIDWFAGNARDLPWRRTTAWGVLVSEFMLQQTPVARVLPIWQQWLERWPRPADLAIEPSSVAVAAWGRLGYPRRALRLHATAIALTHEHDGQVPADPALLRTLPGVGEYTAAAVASFAHGAAVPVLDTNVRRVLCRVATGEQQPPAHLSVAERQLAQQFTDAAGDRAATWAAAAMELGALVCTARNPDCASCPVSSHCAWLAAGRPADTRPTRTQPWHGTDRQCRGVLLEIVRNQASGVGVEVLLDAWHDRTQAERCLAGLLDDGLVARDGHCVRL